MAKSNPSYKLLSEGFTTGAGNNFLLNANVPPFNNASAREALAYAINYAPINKEVYGGLNRISESNIVPGEPGYFGLKTPGYLAYNPTKAQQLVTSLGGLSFTLQCSANSGPGLLECEAFLQDFQAAGMNVKLDPLAHPSYVTALSNASYQVIAPVAFQSGPDPALTLPTYFGATGGNTAFLVPGNPLQGWLTKGAATYVPAQRASWYEKIWSYVVSNAYVVPTAWTGTVIILDKNVYGVTPGNLILSDVYLKG